MGEGADVHRLNGAPARVLAVAVSPDVSSQYIPVMNAIFAAQKLVCSSLDECFLLFLSSLCCYQGAAASTMILMVCYACACVRVPCVG